MVPGPSCRGFVYVCVACQASFGIGTPLDALCPPYAILELEFGRDAKAPVERPCARGILQIYKSRHLGTFWGVWSRPLMSPLCRFIRLAVVDPPCTLGS